MARPTNDPKTERVDVRLPPRILSAVDEWRRVQPDIPSRTEAIRRLVEAGLEAAPKDVPDTNSGSSLVEPFEKLLREIRSPALDGRKRPLLPGQFPDGLHLNLWLSVLESAGHSNPMQTLLEMHNEALATGPLAESWNAVGHRFDIGDIPLPITPAGRGDPTRP